MAENLKALLQQLRGVEGNGDMKASVKEAIADLEENNSLLVPDSSLDSETISHYAGGAGGSRVSSSFAPNVSGMSRSKKAGNPISRLTKKNMKKQHRGNAVHPLKYNHSAPLLDPAEGVMESEGLGGMLVSDSASVGSMGSMGNYSVTSSLSAMSSAYNTQDSDVASRLNSVSSNRTKPSVRKVHNELMDNLSSMTLNEQERATASLVNDIVTSSKLLSASRPGAESKYNPQLEAHLLEFKEGYEARYGKQVKLPSITTLTEPAHAKKLADNALAGEPSEDELSLAASFVDKALHVKKGAIYGKIDSMVTKANIEKIKAVERARKERGVRRPGPATGDDMSISVAGSSSVMSGAAGATKEEEKGSKKDKDKEQDGDSDAYSLDSDLYSDTDSDTASDMSEEEKRERAARKMRKSRKLKQRRKAEERKERQRKGEIVDVDSDSDDDISGAGNRGGPTAMRSLAATFLKEDEDGKVVLDTSSSGFFDRMSKIRKAEQARAVMKARMEEEEVEAERKAKEQEELRLQASTIATAAAPGDGDGDGAEAGEYSSPSVSTAPTTTTTTTLPPGRRDSTLPGARKHSVVLAKLDAAGGYGVSSSSSPGTVGSPGGSNNNTIGGTAITGAVVGDGSTASIGSSLLKYGHERDIAADLMAVSGSPTGATAGAGAGGEGKSSSSSSSSSTRKRTRKAPALKLYNPPGGPLVIGTVNYGLPYGLGLKGSGLSKPMDMAEVEGFQKNLTSAKHQPLVAMVSGRAERERRRIEKKKEKEAQEQERERERENRERAPGARTSLLQMLREEEGGNDDDDESETTPLPGAGAGAGQDGGVSLSGSESVSVSSSNKAFNAVSIAVAGQARTSARAAQAVLTRYQKSRGEYQQVVEAYEESERLHEPWMDDYKWALHNDIGLDIDAKFMQKKLAEKAIRLMMFYILEVQLKNAFTFLRDQTRRVANARLLNAAARINRMGRGLIARQRCRLLMKMMRERLEAQRKKDKQAASFLRRMARVITRNMRRYTKMKQVKRRLLYRRSATSLQRIVRGKMARIRVTRLRHWIQWQNYNVEKIQCSFRQHLARRRTVLFRKLLVVKTLMDQMEAEKQAVKDDHREEGSHTTIKRYYRAYKMKKNLAKLVYWSRFDKAITLQRHIRGHQGRKRAEALLRVKRAKEKRVFDAAACMQRYVRGVNARKIFAALMLEKRKELARKRMKKKQYLENYAINAGKGAVYVAMRKLIPFRYILTWSKALRIQRVWRGHHTRRRVYLMMIRRRIARDNAYFFGKHIGACHLQRIFRGFRIRRGLMRETRFEAAWKLQCFYRQYAARQIKTFHQVRRDAITTLSKNIFLMLRFRKNMRIRREEKKLKKPAMVVQRVWRRALARSKVRRLKDFLRGESERASVNQLRMRYILSGIQLRILMESVKRDLGKAPFNACAEDCVALGPIQALFLFAVGPRARLGTADDLLSNKLDNTNFGRFLSRVKGLTQKGKAADTAAQLDAAATQAQQNLMLHARASRDAKNKAKASGGGGGDNADKGGGTRGVNIPGKGSRPGSSNNPKGGPGTPGPGGRRPGSRGAAASGRGPGRGPGGGSGGSGQSLSAPIMPSGTLFKSFSLLDAIMSKDIDTLLTDRDYQGASLNNTDMDMAASQAKAAGGSKGKEMTYMDFVTAAKILGDFHYNGSEQWLQEKEFSRLTKGLKIGPAGAGDGVYDASTGAKESSEKPEVSSKSGDDSSDSHEEDTDEEESESEEEEEDEGDEEEESLASAKLTKKRRRKNRSKRRPKKSGGFSESGGDSDSDASAAAAAAGDDNQLEAENHAALMEMKKFELQRSLEKAKGAGAMLDKSKRVRGRDNAFGEGSWRAKQLVWPADEITARVPNKQILMVLKMMDSCRLEPWFMAVATWMEKESRASLSRYVRKIGGLYYHMKSAVFRRIMRDRIAARAQMVEYNQQVTEAQRFCRRYIYRRRVQRLAQAVIVKYIPDQGDAYWHNPHTNLSSGHKPKVLGSLDCLSISLPPPALEYVIKCSNCNHSHGTMNCAECEDTYCRPCYNDLHCKGNRTTHNYVGIPICGYCKYQNACRTCLTCMTSKPDAESPQALLSETERGLFCDSCFTHMHDENVHKFEAQPEGIKKAAKHLFQKSAEAYLVQHQLQVTLKTEHQYFNLVQDCEECGSHSAQWRCSDCKQVYCNKCLTALHSMGGPFSRHVCSKLPYYTEEMHRSFLDDQRTQVFKHRMAEVNKLWAERAEVRRQRAILQVQSWWRMIRGAREGRLHMLAMRKYQRRLWRLRQKEMPIRHSMKHQALTLVGAAPHLHSDTIEEDILREISIFGKQFAREYIWRNKDDWGHYKVGKGKLVKFARKGVPRTGFDIGTTRELRAQARCGGYRMPGYVLVKQGESQLKTTCNLKALLKPGMLVKCGPGYFKVRAVSESDIIFDRVYRFSVPLPPEEVERQRANRNPNREQPNLYSTRGSNDSYVGKEVLYRLPVYADEPRRYTYKAYYILSNYAVSNPLSQVYFSTHARLFNVLGDAAETIQALHKRLGFKRGAKAWAKTVAIQNRRAKWATDLLNGDDDIDDLGEVTSKGKAAKKPSSSKVAPEKKDRKVKKGKGMRPKEEAEETEEEKAAREAEEEEARLAAFMGDEVDLDDINDESGTDSRPVTREEGERWIATKEEKEERTKLEAQMTPEELASHAEEWSEHVDPMTENVFWVHDETNEMSMDMPASLKMRNKLVEEKEKTEKLHRAAMEKMQRDKAGSNKKSGGFKKRR